MDRPYKYCPYCRSELIRNESSLLVCPKGDFKFYNNPRPVVAALIPYRGGVVTARRGAAPFIGEWCLPCGNIDQFEDPEEAIKREVREETGLIVTVERLLWAVMPKVPESPVNQIVLHYLCKVTGGELRAGDDVTAVCTPSPQEMPVLCFSTHQHLVADWYEKIRGIRIAA